MRMLKKVPLHRPTQARPVPDLHSFANVLNVAPRRERLLGRLGRADEKVYASAFAGLWPC